MTAGSASPPVRRGIPHDAAKETDNYIAPQDLPLHIWVEIEVHHVYDPETLYFQGGLICFDS